MKPRLLLAAGLFGLVSLLMIPSSLPAQAPQDDGAITLHNLPAPPPLDTLAVPVLEGDGMLTGKHRPAGTSITGLEPPPSRVCITSDERNAALMGTGCSCSCEEYANKPVSGTCDVACGGHYQCWAPEVSDADLDRELAKTFSAATEAGIPVPGLSDEERETMRGAIRATRGLEWNEARLCKE